MPNDLLNKVHKRTAKIRKAHPGMSYKAANKKAWADYKGGKISGARAARKRVAPRHKKKRKVAGTKRRVGDKPKYKVTHHVQRINGVRYKGGTVTIAGTAEVDRQKGKLQAMLGEQLGWLDVAISSAKTKSDKNRLRKKRTQLLSELKRVS
jgi:uncharacterized lipoprotein YmbA